MPNYIITVTGSSKTPLDTKMLGDLVAGTARAVHLEVETITAAEVGEVFFRKNRIRKKKIETVLSKDPFRKDLP